MFDFEYIQRLPQPVIDNILRFLRIPDLIALKSVCPGLSEACDHQVHQTEKEFPHRPFFRMERCAPDAPDELEEDGIMMSERMNAASCFHEPNQAVYLFGGESTRSTGLDNRPTFNDLWKLDAATMKWARVVITSAPYPLPKYHASMVSWKNKLILFGGHRPVLHHHFMGFESEMHYFDVESSTWEYISSEGAPTLSGHSALISDDLMMVYGGWNPAFDEDFSNIMHIYDIPRQTWRTVEFEENGLEIPNLEPEKSKLIEIRRGLLLITGEMESDYGQSILIEYNPVDPYGSIWKWKSVETMGRWWRKKRDPMDRWVPECAKPNEQFWQIAHVRNRNLIRIMSLGMVKNGFMRTRRETQNPYDKIQLKYREFCRQLHLHLDTEFQKRAAENAPETEKDEASAHFRWENIDCHVENCFLQNSNSRQTVPPRVRIHVQILPSEDPKAERFDDFDIWETRCSIRAIINQLHAKYHNSSRMEHLAARVPLRNSALKRLSIYVAHIDCHVDFDNFNEICWIPQRTQYPAPMVTRNYSLIGANHDVIMHSGALDSRESRNAPMGLWALFTPSSTAN